MTGIKYPFLFGTSLIGVLFFLFPFAGWTQTATCLKWNRFHEVGQFFCPDIMECSGISASRKNPGILWVHNDSGDAPKLFAVREDGILRGIYVLEDAQAEDWEDMAWGPCGDTSRPDCLYIGDIGDNDCVRKKIQVYRIPEPYVPLNGDPVYSVLNDIERFDCIYPDGRHDAEALVVDPQTGTPYVITKDIQGKTAVYRLPGTLNSDETTTLEKVGVLPSRIFITGGDAAPDGSRVILRDLWSAYEYTRPKGGAFTEIFSSTPCPVSLIPEIQGESLAIGSSGDVIYTASEGMEAPINRSTCISP